ncbi:hypothetical protein P7B04_22615 [Sphingobium yanoikuyae]|nr:hypothetical protein [Sphingobium yanoikuyae]
MSFAPLGKGAFPVQSLGRSANVGAARRVQRPMFIDDRSDSAFAGPPEKLEFRHHPLRGKSLLLSPSRRQGFFRAQHPPLCAFIALELMGVKFPPYVSKYF